MTDGLWRDDLKCGCQKGAGHSCRPSWVTEEEWAGVALDNITFCAHADTGMDSNAVRLEMKAAPAGNRGLAPALIQAGEEVPMESTHPGPARHSNNRVAQ